MHVNKVKVIKATEGYFKAIGYIWRKMQSEGPTSDEYFHDLCEMRSYVKALFDFLHAYHSQNLSQEARDEIDMAEFKFLSALSKHNIASYMERQEETELGLDLVSRGLLRVKRASDMDD